MAPGESQVWSCSARGWELMFFFVRSSYASKALVIIEWKPEDEEVLWVRDIRLRGKELLEKRKLPSTTVRGCTVSRVCARCARAPELLPFCT